MKKHILFAAALAAIFALSSCNQEGMEPEAPTKGKPVSIFAIISSDVTKVTLGESDGFATKFVWEENDSFVLIGGTNSYTFSKGENRENGKSTFTYDGTQGELPEITSENLSFRYPAEIPDYASQLGTLEGLSDYITLSAEIPEGATSYEGLNVTFSHETAVIRLTLSNEEFKGKRVTSVTFTSTETTYTATSIFTGDKINGSILAYFAVNPGTLTNCVITAVCEGKNYEASLDDSSLAAGELYKVGKTMEKEKVYTDLSPLVEGKHMTANSYIVSVAGSYKFTPTKGNSSETVGAVKYVEVLWESFGTDVTPTVGSLVKNADYSDGYITFQTPDTISKGNAVIAAYDVSDKILWSWHIWLTDEPEGQEYFNNSGTMMECNLGATSAITGNVDALGLLYQWGRKDPFLGSSSISDEVEAKSTIIWPSAVLSNANCGTIEYAIANPTTFIKCNDTNNDWYYTGDLGTDNTRWTDSCERKSIYDPCPAGWRVPDGGEYGIWSKALDSSSSYWETCDNTNKGMDLSGKFGSDVTIWYPASGHRDCYNGSLSFVGGSGYYWSASSNSNRAYLLSLRNDGLVRPSYYQFRAFGFSVRCVRE